MIQWFEHLKVGFQYACCVLVNCRLSGYEFAGAVMDVVLTLGLMRVW